MDPLSIIASAASILELGLKVNKGVHGIVKTWKSASPVLFAIHNEISDLNVVLDHMTNAWMNVHAKADDSKYDAHFLKALHSELDQAERLLGQIDQMVQELRAMSSLRMKFKWLSRNSRVTVTQGMLKDVRMRISELMLAYNVLVPPLIFLVTWSCLLILAAHPLPKLNWISRQSTRQSKKTTTQPSRLWKPLPLLSFRLCSSTRSTREVRLKKKPLHIGMSTKKRSWRKV